MHAVSFAAAGPGPVGEPAAAGLGLRRQSHRLDGACRLLACRADASRTRVEDEARGISADIRIGPMEVIGSPKPLPLSPLLVVAVTLLGSGSKEDGSRVIGPMALGPSSSTWACRASATPALLQ